MPILFTLSKPLGFCCWERSFMISWANDYCCRSNGEKSLCVCVCVFVYRSVFRRVEVVEQKCFQHLNDNKCWYAYYFMLFNIFNVLTSLLEFLCHNQVKEKKKKRHVTAALAFPLDFGTLSPCLALSDALILPTPFLIWAWQAHFRSVPVW